MSATIWRLVSFNDRNSNGHVTKAHVVPASLQRPLMIDLALRGLDTAPQAKTIKTTGMDQPGMIHVERPWERLALSGLEFSVPCEDVLYVLGRIQKLRQRVFVNGLPYFKLHSYTHCFVLKPVHKLSLELQLTQRLQAAETRAAVFYADKQPIATVLRQAAARASGCSIEQVPELASDEDHRHDRFFPKERGQA
jgi:hypothetical protein